MFIKYADLDMLDFFENEPIFIGEEMEAKFIYTMKDAHQFSMALMVDTYEKQIDISITYNNNFIFTGLFAHVLEIKKSGDVLLVEIESKKRLIIKKYPYMGIVIENM